MAQVKQVSKKEVLKLWAIRNAIKVMQTMEKKLSNSIKSCFGEDYTTDRVNVDGMEVLRFWEGVENGQPRQVLNSQAAMEMITSKRIKGLCHLMEMGRETSPLQKNTWQRG